jgi:uncharacterized protein (TIGR00725 family)
MRKTIVGVMGPGDNATEQECEQAYQLGQLIAAQGWVLLTGGRNVGVMDAACRGAKAAGGLTVGILPTKTFEAVSDAVDIAIATDMGNARNNINVLSCAVVIACGMGMGTASEVALAIKNGKSVVLLTQDRSTVEFFNNIARDRIAWADSAEEAIAIAFSVISNQLLSF